MPIALEARGLVKVFGDKHAVDGVDLTIPKGTFYGIAGPNGAGKSTTLRMLSGLLRPDAGTATIDGVPVWPNPLEASAKAKIVNFATNLGALLLFVPHGAVLWGLGAVLAAANMAGGYLGSRTAIARGTGFVRVAFLAVVGVLIVRLGFDVWNESVRGWFATR